MSGDLPALNSLSIIPITSGKLQACNQNSVVEKLVYAKDGIVAWKTPSKNNEKEGWVNIFNQSNKA